MATCAFLSLRGMLESWRGERRERGEREGERERGERERGEREGKRERGREDDIEWGILHTAYMHPCAQH